MSTVHIKDPTHGFIGFDDFETKIINTPMFQRLRNISQLGMANYVYPTSTHSRFEHSLGTLHVISMMYDTLVQQQSKTVLKWVTELASVLSRRYDIVGENFPDTLRRVVRLAGLLHDIGHLPRSHSFEFGLERVVKNKGEKRFQTQFKIHEHVGHKIIKTYFGDILRKEFGGKVDDLLVDIFELDKSTIARRDRDVLWPLHQMTSGELDADRIDYVLRDAENTGSKSGLFDVDMVIRNITITLVENRFFLSYKKKALSAINGFFLFRYNLYVDVYHHAIISLYDTIFAVLVEIFFNDRDNSESKVFLERIYRGELHAGVPTPSKKVDSAELVPLNDVTWENVVRHYVGHVAHDIPAWRDRMSRLSTWNELEGGGYITPYAYISDPILLLRALDDRTFQPISLWKDYATFRSYIIDPVLDLLKEVDETRLLSTDIGSYISSLQNQVLSLTSDDLKGQLEEVFLRGNKLRRHLQGFYKGNNQVRRMQLYIIENIIFKRAFSFSDFEQGSEQFYIKDVLTPLLSFCSGKHYRLRNIFISTKKLIIHKKRLYIDAGDRGVVDMMELSPFFDNLTDQSQDRPLFYLYVQADDREAIRHELDGLRGVVRDSIISWLKSPVGEQTRLQSILQFPEVQKPK